MNSSNLKFDFFKIFKGISPPAALLFQRSLIIATVSSLLVGLKEKVVLFFNFYNARVSFEF